VCFGHYGFLFIESLIDPAESNDRIDVLAHFWPPVALSDLERIARIVVLEPDENLVNVVGMGRVSGQLILQYLEDVLDAGGIIDVNVGYAVTGIIHEECELQVSVMVGRLETFRICKARRRMMQTRVGRVEQTLQDTVLCFFS
jgi:hypothetical protein